MARGIFDSFERFQVASVPISGYPFAMATWFYANDADTAYQLMELTIAASTTYQSLQIAGNAAGDKLQARSNTGGSVYAETSTGFSASTWHHACGIFVSATDRRAFIDGGSKGTNTSSKGFGAHTDTVLGAHRSAGSGGGYLDGYLAEPAMWDLSGWPGADDAARGDNFENDAVPLLSKGFSPLFVPLGLAGYWDLIRGDTSGDEADRVGDVNLTENGTIPVATHTPGIIYPAPPLAGTYTTAGAGGNAPTGHLLGPLYGPLGGPIAA